MNKELAKTLTTALVQFIDRERAEGTMCCSNIECGALEEAFKSDNLDDVETFIEVKLSRLTEFETHLKWLIENGGSGIEHVKVGANELLALAKKELARRDEVITLDNLPSYDKGFQDGKAEVMANLERIYICNPDKLPKWLKDDIATKESNARINGYNDGYKDASEEYERRESYRLWQGV